MAQAIDRESRWDASNGAFSSRGSHLPADAHLLSQPAAGRATASPPPPPRRSPDEPGAGHKPELLTPIHQILGYAHLLARALPGKVSQQHLDDLANLERAARRLLRTVRSESEEDTPPAGPRPMLPSIAEEPTAAPEGGELGFILVVDDSRANRDILCRVLRAHGYRVAAAEDGARALALAARERFDAILLDVYMPGINGLGVLAALRGFRSAAELPVLMVTTRSEGDDVVESLRRGANDHVTKPIDFDVLLARLATQLALKRSREELSRLAQELSAKNEFIQRTFGRYLSEEVVARLLSTPEAQRLGGDKRRVTILMADLRGFTTLTEGMPPEVVMQLLNGFLGEMARVIMARGGTVIEFIGDAVLALFGAPFAADDDARRAVLCALEMQLAMDAVNQHNAALGLSPLTMGIALNTGAVVVGNIGSEARTKYGAVGAQINLTARIESCTVGRRILISETTRVAAGPGLQLGERHELSIKGFHGRVVAHELVGVDELSLPEQRIALSPLTYPIRIVCAEIDGKRIAGDPRGAYVMALSTTGAALHLSPRPAPFADLRLDLPGRLGEQLGGELYAKVLELDADDENLARVHFTTLPPGLAEVIRKLCGT